MLMLLLCKRYEVVRMGEYLLKVLQLSEKLQQYAIGRVVSSPYTRCLETARHVCHAWPQPTLGIEVDNRVSEVTTIFHWPGCGDSPFSHTMLLSA